jgi:hypothetical protein
MITESSVSQTGSGPLLEWTTKVIFKLCIINLCRYHRKVICIEKLRVPHFIIPALHTCNTMSLTLKSFRSSELTMSSTSVTQGISHLYSFWNEGRIFVSLHRLPSRCFCSVYVSIVDFFTVSTDKFVVFSNFVSDGGMQLKFAGMYAKSAFSTFNSFESLNVYCSIAIV